MMQLLSRGDLGRVAAVGAAAVGLQAVTSKAGMAAPAGARATGEKEQLDALYREARAEGGRVVV